jgi:hypothetical protein
MVYDPIQDLLHSSTRRGIKLNLCITVAKTLLFEDWLMRNFFDASRYHKLFEWNHIDEASLIPKDIERLGKIELFRFYIKSTLDTAKSITTKTNKSK